MLSLKFSPDSKTDPFRPLYKIITMLLKMCDVTATRGKHEIPVF